MHITLHALYATNYDDDERRGGKEEEEEDEVDNGSREDYDGQLSKSELSVFKL